MSVREFDRRFGLNTSIEIERSRFVSRIEQTLFRYLEQYLSEDELLTLFNDTCFYLGLNPFRVRETIMGYLPPRFNLLTGDNFTSTLRTIVGIFEAAEQYPNIRESVSHDVGLAIDYSSSNLGIKWINGVFYPSGEKVLDDELIEGALLSLTHYPNENKDIRIALSNYQSGRVDGIIEYCYLAIEGLARKILNNEKMLLNNKGELLQLLGFSKYWGNMLSALIEYANEFRRHAGEDRHNLRPAEVEAFLYLTCLFIRAIVRAHQENKK